MGFLENLLRKAGLSAQAAGEAAGKAVARSAGVRSPEEISRLVNRAEGIRAVIAREAANQPPKGAPYEDFRLWEARMDALRAQFQAVDSEIRQAAGFDPNLGVQAFGDPAGANPDSLRAAVQAMEQPTPAGPAIPAAAAYDRSQRVPGASSPGLRAALERRRAAQAAAMPYRRQADLLRAAIEEATPIRVEGEGVLQTDQFGARVSPAVQEMLDSPDAANILLTLAADLGVPVTRTSNLQADVINAVVAQRQAAARSAARSSPDDSALSARDPDGNVRTPHMGSTNAAPSGPARVVDADGNVIREPEAASTALGIAPDGTRTGVYGGPEPLTPMQDFTVVVAHKPAIGRVTGQPKQAYRIDPASGQPVPISGEQIPAIEPGTTNSPDLTQERAEAIAANGLNYAGVDVSRDVGIYAARTYKNPDGTVTTETDFEKPVIQLVKRRTGGDGNRAPEAVEFLLPLGDGTFQRLTPTGAGGPPEILTDLDVQRLMYQKYEPQGGALENLRPQVESPEVVGRRIIEAAKSAGATSGRTAQAILQQYDQLVRLGGQKVSDEIIAAAGGPAAGTGYLDELRRMAAAPEAGPGSTSPLRTAINRVRVNRDVAIPATTSTTQPQPAAYDFRADTGLGNQMPATRAAQARGGSVDLAAGAVPGASGESVVADLLPTGRPRRNTRAGRVAASTGSEVISPQAGEVFDPAGNETEILANSGVQFQPSRNILQAPELSGAGSMPFDMEDRYDLFRSMGLSPYEARDLSLALVVDPDSWAAHLMNPKAAQLARMLQQTRMNVGAGGIEGLPSGFRRTMDAVQQHSMPNTAFTQPAMTDANTGMLPTMTKVEIGGDGPTRFTLNPAGPAAPDLDFLQRQFSDDLGGALNRQRLAEIVSELQRTGRPLTAANILEEGRLRLEAENNLTGFDGTARDPASEVTVDDSAVARRDSELKDQADTADDIDAVRQAGDPARGWLPADQLRRLFKKAFPKSKNYPLGLQEVENRPASMREPTKEDVEKYRTAATRLEALMEKRNLGVPDEERSALNEKIREARKEERRLFGFLTRDPNKVAESSGSYRDRMMQVVFGGGTDRVTPVRDADMPETYGGSSPDYEGVGGFDVGAAVEGKPVASGADRRKPTVQATSSDAALVELLRSEHGDARAVVDGIVEQARRQGIALTPEQVLYSMFRDYQGGISTSEMSTPAGRAGERMARSDSAGTATLSDDMLRDLSQKAWQDIERTSPKPAPPAAVGEYSTAQKIMRAPDRIRETLGKLLRPGPLTPGRATPDAPTPQDEVFAMMPDPEAISPTNIPGAPVPPDIARQAQSQLAAAEQRMGALEAQGVDIGALRDRAQRVREAIALRLRETPARADGFDPYSRPGTELGEGVDDAVLAEQRRVAEEGLTEEEATQSLEDRLAATAARKASEQKQRSFVRTAEGRRFLEETLQLGGYGPAAGRMYEVDEDTARRLQDLAGENMGGIVARNRTAAERDLGSGEIDTSNPLVFGVKKKGDELHEIAVARESGDGQPIESLFAKPVEPGQPVAPGRRLVRFNGEGVPELVEPKPGVRFYDRRGLESDFDEPQGKDIDLSQARTRGEADARRRATIEAGEEPRTVEPPVASRARQAQQERAAVDADETVEPTFDELNRQADAEEAAAQAAADTEPKPAAAADEAVSGRDSVDFSEVTGTSRTAAAGPPAAGGRARGKGLKRAAIGSIGAGALYYGARKAQEEGYLPTSGDLALGMAGQALMALPGYGGGELPLEDTKQVQEPIVARVRRAREPFLTLRNFMP